MAGGAKRAFRPGLWLTLFTLPALAVLIGLGVWQLDRRAWKQDLVAGLTERVTQPPLTDLSDSGDTASIEFRRVRLHGTFAAGGDQLLVGRSHQGLTGYGVFSPLALAGGRFVFVDRGWIPVAAKTGASWRAKPGTELVDGVVRLPQPGFSDAMSRGNEHYRLALRAMAREAGLDPESVLPVYVVVAGPANPGSLPVPRTAAIELTDNHLQYAVTWFALAAALVVIYVLASRRA